MAGMSTQNWNQNPNEPNDQASWGSSWDAVGRPNPPQPGQPPEGIPGQPGPTRPYPGQPLPNGSASEPTIPGFQPGVPASQPTAPPPGEGNWVAPGWNAPQQDQWQTGWHNSTQQPDGPRYGDQPAGQQWQPPPGQAWAGDDWNRTPAPRPARTSPLAGFLSALFDLDFRRYVTPQIVRILYILSIIAVGLYWIGSVITLFAASRSTSVLTGQTTTNGGVVFLAVLDLLIGWIFALAAIALVRMQYEYILALIRTSEYARDIKAHLGAPNAGDSQGRGDASRPEVS